MCNFVFTLSSWPSRVIQAALTSDFEAQLVS